MNSHTTVRHITGRWGAEGSRGSFLRANGEQDPKSYLGARCNAPPKVVNTTELGLGSATVRPSGLEWRVGGSGAPGLPPRSTI